jgi:general secretion pathway protein G
MKNFSSEQRIYFPWESRGGLRRFLNIGRARPIVIGFLLVAFLTLVGLRERERAGVRQTRATLNDLRHAADGYVADHNGGCPTSVANVLDYGKFEKEPRDAWGRPFRLTCSGSSDGLVYQLMSDGPDGEPGGLDRVE